MNSIVGPQDLQDLMVLIDHDHQQLHDLLDGLKAAVAAGDWAGASRTLLDLQVLEARHFAAEEVAMRRLGYPHYMDHKDHHETLRETLEAIGRFLLLEQPRQLHDSIVDYAGQTLTHIEELDRPLRAFLQASPA